MLTTQSTSVSFALTTPGDYYVSVMPFDAHGESVGRTLYPLSEEIRIPGWGPATGLYRSAPRHVLAGDVSGGAVNSDVGSPVGIDGPIARDRDADGNVANSSEERLHAVQDANFNVTGLLATSGPVAGRDEYGPYGSVTYLAGSWGGGSSSSLDWRIEFPGLGYHAVAGGSDARARDERSSLGRFARSDPIGRFAGDGIDYRQVDDNPVLVIDPWGLQSADAPPAQLG